MSTPSIVDRQAFLQALTARFPEVAKNITDIESGLLHPEMSVLSRATADAIDAQRWQTAESHFSFIAEVLAGGDEAVKNAVYVSYLEHVFLGEVSDKHLSARAMLPCALAKALAELENHFASLSHATRDA